MGTYASGTAFVKIKKENLPKAMELLDHGVICSRIISQKKTVRDELSWAIPDKYFPASLDEWLGPVGFLPEYDGEGNLTKLFYESEGYRFEDILILALLSPVMEPGGHMDLADENMQFWREVFDPDHPDSPKYEPGMIVFPSDGVGHVAGGEGSNEDEAFWVPEP